MIQLKNAIDKWMSEWEECYYCNDMVKVELLNSDNEDNPICKFCTGEEPW